MSISESADRVDASDGVGNVGIMRRYALEVKAVKYYSVMRDIRFKEAGK